MLNAVSVFTFSLTVKELKKYRANDAKLFKELGLKNKYLKSLTKVSAET